jgi:hypothetical protein
MNNMALWCSGNMPAFGASVSGSTPLRAVYHRKIIFIYFNILLQYVLIIGSLQINQCIILNTECIIQA